MKKAALLFICSLMAMFATAQVKIPKGNLTNHKLANKAEKLLRIESCDTLMYFPADYYEDPHYQFMSVYCPVDPVASSQLLLWNPTNYRLAKASTNYVFPSQTANSGKFLTTNGSYTSWATLPTAPGTVNTAAYSAGTVYTLTTTSQKVDFGTTDPVVTIPSPGTYLIFTNIKLEANGLTLAVARQSDFKLRRTNNTAADIPNAVTNFKSPAIAVAQNGTAGDVDMAVIKYTTENSGDVLELWGSISGSTLSGTMTVGEASVVAVKIY